MIETPSPSTPLEKFQKTIFLFKFGGDTWRIRACTGCCDFVAYCYPAIPLKLGTNYELPMAEPLQLVLEPSI